MQFFQKLALRVAGVFESEDSKQDELRTALSKANVKAVETALLKGAVPELRQLGHLLINEDVRNCLTDKTFIETCRLFQKWGVNLDRIVRLHPGRVWQSGPTLIGRVIEQKLGPTVTQFLVNSGVEPTVPDLHFACQKEADPKHLEILLKTGIDPYETIVELGGSVCILQEVIANQDLDKTIVVTNYPWQEASMQTSSAYLLFRLAGAACIPSLNEEFAPDFAVQAISALRYLMPFSIREMGGYINDLESSEEKESLEEAKRLKAQLKIIANYYQLANLIY